jgi:hypothetical protein
VGLYPLRSLSTELADSRNLEYGMILNDLKLSFHHEDLAHILYFIVCVRGVLRLYVNTLIYMNINIMLSTRLSYNATCKSIDLLPDIVSYTAVTPLNLYITAKLQMRMPAQKTLYYTAPAVSVLILKTYVHMCLFVRVVCLFSSDQEQNSTNKSK